MRRTARMRVAAVAAAVGMLTAACGGGGSEPGNDDGEAGGGDLRIYNSEPAFLVPTAANDEPSILVIRQMFRGLVKYNAETGAPELDLAESIETEDNQTWTIKVKEGYTFSNGEPVDADSFLRAWNYAGNLKNAQNNAYFMNRIAGFEEMQSEDVKPDETFSGLKKVDDYTFTVELSEPFVGLEAILGYSGFFPVAEECLADFDACNEEPITNGPYQMAAPWEHNVQIQLERFDDWAGDEGDHVSDTLTYKIYDSVETAYAAFQGGELDIMYSIPPTELGEIEEAQGENIYQVPGDSFTYVGMPLYDPQFDNKELRQAFSMAINRQAIIDAIFNGAFFPATGFVSPNFDGYQEGVCEYCTYDLERAQELYESSGGYDGKLTLWANAGAGHEDWLQAVGDQLNEAFGIEYELRVDLDFPAYLELADNEGFDGPFRLGWGPDYPVMETYLAPLYGTGASSNSSGYSNPEFDELIAAGDASPTLEEAIPQYQAAEQLVAEDLPVIPMWFSLETKIWSDNVAEFKYNTISDVEYGQIVLN